MTPADTALARHALGLDGRRRRSYRNYFVASPGTPDEAAWRGLVAQGLAVSRQGRDMTTFWLTLVGAQRVLRPGETLDLDDFPSSLREPVAPVPA